MEYELIRSNRKTIAAEIKGDRLFIRAPLRVTEKELDDFILRHRRWIEAHLEKARARKAAADALPKLTAEELQGLANRAMQVIPARVAYFAPQIGVTYGRVTIRNQKTRWGSCSSKGNLSFNCLLMLAPPEVLDSIVVHELCHRKEMNHSQRFYQEVLRVFPDYWACHTWLRENGPGLMARMTE